MVFLTIVLILAAVLVALRLWTRRLTQQGLTTVPQLGEILPVSGGSIHYVEKGDPSRQTLVLIHGLSGQLQHFTYALVDDLAQDYHVLAVDRPGCGYSTRQNADLAALPEQARMIHEFLVAKNVEQAVLVGHSLGGAVSLAMALDFPQQVKALALLAPLTQDMRGTPEVFKALEIRTEWLRALIGHTIAVPLAKKTAPMVLDQVFAPEPAPVDFLDRAGGALGLRPSAFITASQDVIGVESSLGALSRRYPNLQTRGGVLFGLEDPVLSAKAHGASMAAFGLTYEPLEGRGHMLPITVPDICARFIRKVAEPEVTPKSQTS